MFSCAQCKGPVSAGDDKCLACGFVFNIPKDSSRDSSEASSSVSQPNSHWVRKLTYFVALCAVAYSSLRLAGPKLGFQFEYDVFSHSLGLPVPRIYGWDLALSQNSKELMSLVLLVLVLRRLGLMLVTGFELPRTYQGPLYYLMLIPVWSLYLGVLAFGVTILIGAPSGVPAALVGLPAAFFLATGIALIELLSLWPWRS